MPSEATIQNSLQIQKDTLVYRSQPTVFQADVFGTNGPSPGAIIVPPTGVNVDFSELENPSLCRLMNLDAVNFVTYGIWFPQGWAPQADTGVWVIIEGWTGLTRKLFTGTHRLQWTAMGTYSWMVEAGFTFNIANSNIWLYLYFNHGVWTLQILDTFSPADSILYDGPPNAYDPTGFYQLIGIQQSPGGNYPGTIKVVCRACNVSGVGADTRTGTSSVSPGVTIALDDFSGGGCSACGTLDGTYTMTPNTTYAPPYDAWAVGPISGASGGDPSACSHFYFYLYFNSTTGVWHLDQVETGKTTRSYTSNNPDGPWTLTAAGTQDCTGNFVTSFFAGHPLTGTGSLSPEEPQVAICSGARLCCPTGGRFLPLGELLPGETYTLRLSRFLGRGFGTLGTATLNPPENDTKLRFEADQATCRVLVEAFDI